jgi:pimeloyl-ACP methyl ester carboxylesterase
MTPRSHFLPALSPQGFHRLHYLEWAGGDALPPVICVHGLTRNARDFAALAAALAPARRVLALDVLGRGDSDWARTPALYAYPQYCNDAAALIARSGADAVDWVGTSMGGLIGLMLAALPGSPIRRLVLNDVGPFIPAAAIADIARHLGEAPDFADIDEAAAHIARVNAGFGPLSPADWRALAASSVKPRGDGRLVWKRDPAIGAAVAAAKPADVDIWALWDGVRCPVLVLRGGESGLLTAETAAEMTRRGPGARLATFAGVGHAPALMAPDQIAPIRDFLSAP